MNDMLSEGDTYSMINYNPLCDIQKATHTAPNLTVLLAVFPQYSDIVAILQKW